MAYQKNKLLVVCSILALSLSAGAQTAYPLLEKMVEQKKYAKAYQRAVKLRLENEGDPRFDYLYGFSALQAGHYNEAVFALDRVTVSTPNVIRPRLELARAYLKLNNSSAAIKEFNDVLNLSPPPVVREKVMAYIAELQKSSDVVTRRSITKRLASFSIGYDDNINFGNDSDEIELPGFGVFKLDPLSVKQGSGFAEAKFQIKQRTLKNKQKSTFFLANLSHKKYFKDNNLDLLDLDLRVGLTLNRNKKQYQFVARTRPIMLDGSLHSNTLGVDAIARKSLGNATIGSIRLSVEKYDNKNLSISDRSRAILSGRLDKEIAEIQHQFNLHIGKEWPDESKGKQFSRNIVGAGYLAVRKWNKKHRTYLGLDYRHYKHQQAYPVFPEIRADDRFTVKAGHEWQINDKFALTFSAQHINNKSNLDLYDAKRNQIKVGIRYDFD